MGFGFHDSLANGRSGVRHATAWGRGGSRVRGWAAWVGCATRGVWEKTCGEHGGIYNERHSLRFRISSTHYFHSLVTMHESAAEGIANSYN